MRTESRPDPGPSSGNVGRIVTLVITLAVLMGVTYLIVNLNPPDWNAGYLAILTGFVLLVASVAGSLAVRAGLPRLTGFVVVGILAGPSVLGILSDEAVRQLRLIDEFALALIALLAGGELKKDEVLPRIGSIGWTTVAVTLVVWVGMTVAVVAIAPFLPFLAQASFSTKVAVALILGIWAANSSPDLTVAVIEETGAKGRLADVILGTTIVKDVLVIVLFTLTLTLVAPMAGGGQAEGSTLDVFLTLGQEVGGAVVVGAFLGWVFSLYLQSGEGDRPPLATFLFAYVIVVVANRLHIELLLSAVAAGFVIENLSPAGDRMIRGVERVSVVLFAFFFTLAGSSLDLQAVRTVWLGAILVFTVRVALTWLGAMAGTKLADAAPVVRERTWQGLVSQGGVTLGLLVLAQDALGDLGDGIMNLGMAVVLGGILVGPILLKVALSAGAGSGGSGEDDGKGGEEGEGDSGAEPERAASPAPSGG
ncbi:MAG: cation:proton antiporter [Longimicrobiales bacterium]|nr:cation:proton antiporter [Longimicrobiales bacterium]